MPAPVRAGAVQAGGRVAAAKPVDVSSLHSRSSETLVDDGSGVVKVYRIIDVTKVREARE
jgi:hypothetical protein